MSGDAKKLQPIIVKRIKKAGHAAHGGAWKIAYADFVTAMMAFFLLMWLLGSTTEGDKKGIADFFQTPLKVALAGGGSGSGDSSSLIKGGGQDFTRTFGQVKRGDIVSSQRTFNLQALKAEQRRAEAQRMQEIADRMAKEIAGNAKLQGLAGQVMLEATRDGLRIQIVDEADRPMFDGGSAIVKPHLRDLLTLIAEVLNEVPFALTLEGHTDATPFPAGSGGYGNWELSSDRANAARRELVASGLGEDRFVRVQGLASSQPLHPETPADPRNRRISIIVMNHEAERHARYPDEAVGGIEGAPPEPQAPPLRAPPSGQGAAAAAEPMAAAARGATTSGARSEPDAAHGAAAAAPLRAAPPGAGPAAAPRAAPPGTGPAATAQRVGGASPSAARGTGNAPAQATTAGDGAERAFDREPPRPFAPSRPIPPFSPGDQPGATSSVAPR